MQKLAFMLIQWLKKAVLAVKVFQVKMHELGMVAQTFNPNMWEAGQGDPYEYEGSLVYTAKSSCLNKTRQNKDFRKDVKPPG